MKNLYLFMLVISTLSAQIETKENRLFWDGGDWKRITQLANHNTAVEYRIKVAYISGVLDGRLFYYLKTWAEKQSFADSLYAETIDYLTPRQMIRNIDLFYQEPTHVYVPVVSAMVIANMHGEQAPQRLIDAYVDQTKFWINQLMLDMEAEGMHKLLEGKQQKHSQKLPRN